MSHKKVCTVKHIIPIMFLWTYLENRLSFRVSGEKVLDFLQGLVPANTKKLSQKFPEGSSKIINWGPIKDDLEKALSKYHEKISFSNGLWSCLLTPQGKFYGDFFATYVKSSDNLTETESLIIECHQDAFPLFFQRLKSFDFKKKFSISPLPHYKTFVLFPSSCENSPFSQKDCSSFLKQPNFNASELKNFFPTASMLDFIKIFDALKINDKTMVQKSPQIKDSSRYNDHSVPWSETCFIYEDPRGDFLHIEPNSQDKPMGSQGPDHLLGYRLVLDTYNNDSVEQMFSENAYSNNDPHPLSEKQTKQRASYEKNYGPKGYKSPWQHPWIYVHPKYYQAFSIIKGLGSFEDLQMDRSIILEYGFHHLGAISWNKGCYLGQELMARTFYKGNLRKKIYILVNCENLGESGSNVEANKGFPPSETPFTLKGRKIGIMKSSCDFLGLALINTDAMEKKDLHKITCDQGTFFCFLPSFYP